MVTEKDALKIIAKLSINPKEIANAQKKVKEREMHEAKKEYNREKHGGKFYSRKTGKYEDYPDWINETEEKRRAK